MYRSSTGFLPINPTRRTGKYTRNKRSLVPLTRLGRAHCPLRQPTHRGSTGSRVDSPGPTSRRGPVKRPFKRRPLPTRLPTRSRSERPVPHFHKTLVGNWFPAPPGTTRTHPTLTRVPWLSDRGRWSSIRTLVGFPPEHQENTCPSRLRPPLPHPRVSQGLD